MDSNDRTLWMGDIQLNWDEVYIGTLFTTAVEQPIVKLIRDKVTGYPAGYCFLEFPTPRGAQAVLEQYNGQLIPNTIHRFRMNWGGSGRRLDSDNDHSIFVGDLAPDVTDDILFTTFSSRFSSVRGAKVVVDSITRMSKGFGFVRFASKEEADHALQTMSGVYCGSRPMRVSVATSKIPPRPGVTLPTPISAVSTPTPPVPSTTATTMSHQYSAAAYHQQQQQQAYQNYYGYGAYYQQPYAAHTGAYGYGAYGYGYQQPPQHQQAPHFAGHARYQAQTLASVQPQQTKQPSGSDFTKPDDIQAMNRRFAAQRAYQQFPPVNGASYKHMSSNPAQATAMAGKN